MAALGLNSRFQRPCSTHHPTLLLFHADTCLCQPHILPMSSNRPASRMTMTSVSIVEPVSKHSWVCWPCPLPYTTGNSNKLDASTLDFYPNPSMNQNSTLGKIPFSDRQFPYLYNQSGGCIMPSFPELLPSFNFL